MYLWFSLLRADEGGSMVDRLDVDTPASPNSLKLAKLGLTKNGRNSTRVGVGVSAIKSQQVRTARAIGTSIG